MEKTLVIGVVAKPQGIRGELKITPYTDDVNRFARLKSVIIDGKNYSVTAARACGDFAIVSLLGVNDRNTAELFRGKFLHVSRENAVKPKKGSYFIVDIIGCSLKSDNGETIGTIADVTTSKTDVFTVLLNNGKTMRFPFLKEVIEKVDIENSEIIANSKRLKEVACYED